MAANDPSPSLSSAPAKDEFVISRVFDGPRDLVWRAWTEPERLAEWWGPKGFKVLSTKVDLKPGGMFLYQLSSPDGEELWGRFIYREIAEPERLVFVVSFSDEAGGVTRHPMHPRWPLYILSTVTFAEENGKTRVTVHWVPVDATEEERKTFEDGRPSMQQGWTGTLDRLEAYFARV